MPIFHINTTLKDDGEIKISGLPLNAGEKVEIIIRSKHKKPSSQNKYPLRSLPFIYLNPFEGVGEDDWDVLNRK